MSRVSIVVKVPAAPGKGNEMAAAFEEALEHVRNESGTRYYIVHADASNPDTIWVYEMYDSQADLDAHMGADWFKAFSKNLGSLVGGAPEFHALRPLAGKGM